MGIQKYDQYRDRWNQKVTEFKAGPVEERSCNDICCLITFFILFLLTIGGGIFFMAKGSDLIEDMVNQASQVDTVPLGSMMSKYAPYIVGMMALSICLSILFVFLSRLVPKCLIYSMIVLTFLVYLAVIILGFVIENYALAIVFIIILLINALILWCYWDYIRIGLVLLECAGRFITQKPAVYFIAGLCFVLNTIFTIFWIFSWLGVYSVGVIEKNKNGGETFVILSYVWYAFAVFFAFFLYYCMVFLVAVATAYWYYQSEDNSVMRGFNHLKYQIGPITFGAIVITIITMLRIISQAGRTSNNGILRCIACIIHCILSCIEEIMKALNHNAVIVMAVTGQGYLDSAKSAIGLIFDNFGLFVIVDFFGQFMEVYEFIVCVLIPALLGGGLVYNFQGEDIQAAIWTGVIILLLASIVSSVIIGMLDEALSSIFIFYCFDKKFHEMGMQVNNVPEEIRELFREGENSEEAQNARQSLFTKDYD